MEPYYVLLYYCYSKLIDVEEFRNTHHQFCLSLHLKGRIIISQEGINGTVSGLKKDCEKYMDAFKKLKGFEKTQFKIDLHNTHTFEKLHIRIKDEIVHSGLKHIDPEKKTGLYLSPEKFKKAITLDINHFREFSKKIPELKKYKEKKIITYCTGGIKCEKASAFLLKKGFKNIYQLHGGIINYGIEEKGEDFEGVCYVFDNRVKTNINKVNPKIISVCHICKKECDKMVNCVNPLCNLHTTICVSCMEVMEGACSLTCKKANEKRNYHPKGYYPKESNGYNPYKCSKR